MIKKLVIAVAFVSLASVFLVVPSKATTPIRRRLMAQVTFHGIVEIGPINFSHQELDPNYPSGDHYEVVTEFKTSNIETLQHQSRISSQDEDSSIRVFWQ